VYYTDGLPHKIAKALVETYSPNLSKTFQFLPNTGNNFFQRSKVDAAQVFGEIISGKESQFWSIENFSDRDNILRQLAVSGEEGRNLEVLSSGGLGGQGLRHGSPIDRYLRENFEVKDTAFFEEGYRRIYGAIARTIDAETTRGRGGGGEGLELGGDRISTAFMKGQISVVGETLNQTLVKSELEKIFAGGKNIFYYENIPNKIAQIYNSDSQAASLQWGQVLANIKAILDFVLKDENILFVLASGHGNFGRASQVELTNFGPEDTDNTGFSYFFSKRFADPTLYTPKTFYNYPWADRTHLGSMVSLLVENVAIPL
jgi:hypothetical protein